MNILKPVCVLALLLFLPPDAPSVSAQQQLQEGVQQFADLGNLKLQNGSVIFDFRVGYRTLGRLNAGKSNAILWPTWLGGTSQDLLEFIGPEKVLDSSKYFVVLVDAIGAGVTTSPSNSKTQPFMKFPKFSIRDMVEAEYRCQQQLEDFPRSASLPSHKIRGVTANAATGSAQETCHMAFTASPPRAIAER